jgi:hypothetical protein
MYHGDGNEHRRSRPSASHSFFASFRIGSTSLLLVSEEVVHHQKPGNWSSWILVLPNFGHSRTQCPLISRYQHLPSGNQPWLARISIHSTRWFSRRNFHGLATGIFQLVWWHPLGYPKRNCRWLNKSQRSRKTGQDLSIWRQDLTWGFSRLETLLPSANQTWLAGQSPI